MIQKIYESQEPYSSMTTPNSLKGEVWCLIPTCTCMCKIKKIIKKYNKYIMLLKIRCRPWILGPVPDCMEIKINSCLSFSPPQIHLVRMYMYICIYPRQHEVHSFPSFYSYYLCGKKCLICKSSCRNPVNVELPTEIRPVNEISSQLKALQRN